MKADLYTELKNTVKAEETLLTLKKEFPDDLEVLKSVISYYEQQGENNKAIDMIEELIDNDPNNGIAHFVLANNYLEQNRSEEHTSELQSRPHLVCRLLLEKKKKN